MPNEEMKAPKPGRKSAIFWTVAGIALMVFGLLMILIYGAHVIAPPRAASGRNLLWLVILLAFLGAVFLARGISHNNAGTCWFAWLFLWCAAVTAVGNFTNALAFPVIWPAYVLSPAVASAFTWLFFAAKAAHLKAIIFFSALSLIFFLNSTHALGAGSNRWWWTGGIIVFALGAMLLINAFTRKRGRWDDADNNKIDKEDNVRIK